ncbi:hypothetical protein IMCC12053_704 [Celeribacter marinus]|uniref:Uncharacterized protein n=1 Tax=Celeribacter marinus TaxID=1397108 RepID=A0A0N9ZFY4_9RHOB|nr:hypothetical protein IMCC12053_704 [Celeribacter marinus]
MNTCPLFNFFTHNYRNAPLSVRIRQGLVISSQTRAPKAHILASNNA